MLGRGTSFFALSAFSRYQRAGGQRAGGQRAGGQQAGNGQAGNGQAGNGQAGNGQAGRSALRGLIDEIRLTPIDGQRGEYLVGNLAAILNLCAKKYPGSIETGVQIALVAGARNRHWPTSVPTISVRF